MSHKDFRDSAQFNVYRQNYEQVAVRLPRVAVGSLRRNGKHRNLERNELKKCRRSCQCCPHGRRILSDAESKWRAC